MSEPWGRILVCEYFYKRLSELDDEQRKLIYTLRTKRSLIPALDKLRYIELEKQILLRIYEDLKGLL
jgi:hypothetical protein